MKPKIEFAIETARVADAKAIQGLIALYANKREMLHRSLNEILERIRDYRVVRNDGQVVASCCLSVCWDDLAEIKALAVHPDHSGNGIGSSLVRDAVRQATDLGLPRVFALTYQKGFFLKNGFREIGMEDLPKKVWGECIRCYFYPDCNEEAVIIDSPPEAR